MTWKQQPHENNILSEPLNRARRPEWAWIGAIGKKNTRDPKCLARSTCLLLQPTGRRMVTTLPTEISKIYDNLHYRKISAMVCCDKFNRDWSWVMHEDLISVKVFFFFAPGREWSSLSYFPFLHPEACHALTGAVFHLSKMRAHGAADARVTSGALFIYGPRRVFRGWGWVFRV